MRSVAIAGVGQTAFGEMDRGLPALGRDAVAAALDDAAVDPERIEAAFVGNVGGPADPQRGIVGQVCLREAGLSGLPVLNVENACSSSATAVRTAYREIAAGLLDVALVLGVEKMTGVSTAEATSGLTTSGDVRRESQRGFTFPALYAMRANAYADRFGIDDERLRAGLSAIAVKNHRNGHRNPVAHFSNEIDPADVADSPPIAEPLRLYDMCPNSDGGAAMVLAAGEVLDDVSSVTIDASVHRTGTYDASDASFATATHVSEAVAEAYEAASITAADIDLAEVHDAATIGELLNLEALGVCSPGDGLDLVLAGETAIDGDLPVNPSGGLKARGHPIGATGVAQLIELVRQLRGEAGDRQVEGATVGLAENAGGALNGVSANTTVHVLSV